MNKLNLTSPHIILPVGIFQYGNDYESNIATELYTRGSLASCIIVPAKISSTSVK